MEKEQIAFLNNFRRQINTSVIGENDTTVRLEAVSDFFYRAGEDVYFFKLQNGPIKEAGINGCQIDDVLKWCRKQINNFNHCFPCRENSLALTKIDEALHWLLARTSDREARGVEGKNET